MKKSLIAPVAIILAVVVVAAAFVYFFVSLNRIDKKITSVQASIVSSSQQLSTVVNFLNSASNVQTSK